MTIHFLHIGKTGGSAVKAALRRFQKSHDLALYRHDKTLKDVPPGDKALFAVRDPIGRFVSGFNSRLRKAQPLAYKEWSGKERLAFERFLTPNALAEALSSDDAGARAAAHAAMAAIQHVRAPLARWFSAEELAARENDVLFVISQPDLAADFAVVGRMLGLPARATLPLSEVVSHKTPPGFETELSPRARANIEAWYAEDIALHRACLALREKRLAAFAAVGETRP